MFRRFNTHKVDSIVLKQYALGCSLNVNFETSVWLKLTFCKASIFGLAVSIALEQGQVESIRKMTVFFLSFPIDDSLRLILLTWG